MLDYQLVKGVRHLYMPLGLDCSWQGDHAAARQFLTGYRNFLAERFKQVRNPLVHEQNVELIRLVQDAIDQAS